ncbi:MAG: DUF5681 domain-containing protein [Pseudomonadota bacterium]
MPFRKGRSGNPGGRPKERHFRDALRAELASAGEDHKALRKIARALVAKATGGDLAAIKEIADRLDGKPVQQNQITGADNEPVDITVRFVSSKDSADAAA